MGQETGDLALCSLIPDTLLLHALVLLAVKQEQIQHFSERISSLWLGFLTGPLYVTEKY